jgi:hypothetical protein
MFLRRAMIVAVQLYLMLDYCNPSTPGVFSFGPQSFFIESIDVRADIPVHAIRPAPSPWAIRDTPDTPRTGFTPRFPHRLVVGPYSPRAHIVASSTRSPADSSEDH